MFCSFYSDQSWKWSIAAAQASTAECETSAAHTEVVRGLYLVRCAALVCCCVSVVAADKNTAAGNEAKTPEPQKPVNQF